MSLEKLKERIAQALGWSENEVNTLSLSALREIVRPVSPKLAHELADYIRSGGHITANQPVKRRPKY